MEEQKFELLDEVEQLKDETPAKPALKEYEKLLLLERDRKEIEKASSLVEAGCFEQKQVPVIDFNDYEKILAEKKYKKAYDLYRNKNTLELVFICPLLENNKGDMDEKKDMTPYAYDCLFVESMDAETYDMVMKAAKNNIKTRASVLYNAAWIVYWVYLAVVAIFFGFNLYSNAATEGSGVGTVIFSTLYYCAPFFAGAVINLPLLFIASLKYKKYKAQ